MYDYLPGFEVDVTNYEDNTPYLGNTRLCGSDAYPPMISHTNRVVIKFYSDSSDEEAGFQLHWTAVEFPTERKRHVFDFCSGICTRPTSLVSTIPAVFKWRHFINPAA